MKHNYFHVCCFFSGSYKGVKLVSDRSKGISKTNRNNMIDSLIKYIKEKLGDNQNSKVPEKIYDFDLQYLKI